MIIYLPIGRLLKNNKKSMRHFWVASNISDSFGSRTNRKYYIRIAIQNEIDGKEIDFTKHAPLKIFDISCYW